VDREKGLDLYHVSLAMLTWGDRWLAPEGAPVTLTHTPCRLRFNAELSCLACGDPVSRTDISFASAIAASS
jgi:hypothetical protein